MAKTITFTYRENEYVLEFTRKSIEKMEKDGFDVNEIEKKPMTTLPKLFYGSFKANHPYVSKETTDAIFELMPNKDKLLSRLAEMYSEPITTLFDEPKDDDTKVEWGANW